MGSTKRVYGFEEGNRTMKYVLGGKGANLAEMTNMGLPVPPGFTITCQACNEYQDAGRQFPAGLLDEVDEHVAALERKIGRTLGDPNDPQLVSVRSGAAFSMPGMMDTVLNIGLNDVSVHGLAKQTDSERFAWDSYRRLVQMFGKTVLGLEGDLFEDAIEHAREAKGVKTDVELDVADLQGLVETFKGIIRTETSTEFPQEPIEQLRASIEAVFGSWGNRRAIDYRRKNKIDDALGTAVNVQTMVFGNKGAESGTGVAFTRNPANGENHPYGDYLENAQGEDVVAGIRNTLPLAQMGSIQPQAWEELQAHMKTLERHYQDMCDIEFTVEQGKLWLLQTRTGKRTAVAEWIMAYDMVSEELIEADTGMTRITADRLEELFKQVIAGGAGKPIATGLNASPGAAVGRAVFTADDAQAWHERGEHVILVRRETTPDDYHGMISSQGILTSAGGTNSHAAVVARGEGIPAVCGADALRVDRVTKQFTVGGQVVAEGDWLTIDGFSGNVYLGQLDLADSPVEKARAGDVEARKEKIWQAYELFMARADEVRTLKVRTNADTPQQAANAVERGAEGIGLCRTEHMFLGEERVAAVRKMIFAATPEEEQTAYDALLPLQRGDFQGIFEAMEGRPVTVRLLDPPLHEFLPDLTELAVAVAVAEATGTAEANVPGEGKLPVAEAKDLLGKVTDMHESNPMLGLRGVRLGILKPGLYAMQTRAIVEAAAQVKKAGGDPKPEIMIPLVATREELAQMRAELEPVAKAVLAEHGVEIDVPFGTMIELPRAAVTSGEIAEVADFFSYGTNDLSQTAFGFSRDDIGKFLGLYEERKLVPANPFATLDRPGVGRLMKLSADEGRATRPGMKLGICGEHGGDPESVGFCHEIGLDYVSCSPFRVPTARLAAAQAVLGESQSQSR